MLKLFDINKYGRIDFLKSTPNLDTSMFRKEIPPTQIYLKFTSYFKKHRDGPYDLPASIKDWRYDYFKNNMFHRVNGPACGCNNCDGGYYLYGTDYMPGPQQ